MSSDDVARVIYEAATDGTPRLRYLIGDDSWGFIRARREMPDQDYVDFMRSKFPAVDAERKRNEPRENPNLNLDRGNVVTDLLRSCLTGAAGSARNPTKLLLQLSAVMP